MNDFQDMLDEYYSRHNKFSIRTSWHQQHVIENILDLKGFFHSISEKLEDEKLKEPITSYPLGYFQIEQTSRIRYTNLIFVFTILERRVRALLKLTCELKVNITNEISDYKGSFLDRTKQFLKDNLDIDLSTEPMWQQVMILQKVRDCIIHCGGNINESRDKEFLQHLADKKLIDLNGNGYMRIDIDFCGNMEGAVIEFITVGLENLYKKLIEIEKGKNNA